MAFWSMAYKYKWVTIDQLRLVVKTEQNIFGEITPAEIATITGEKY